jgi:glycosyltransferase involved in cell wall biosynthesis
VPNFIEIPRLVEPVSALAGQAGQRMICVANLRRQKDHLTLIEAMARVVEEVPFAHLFLVGSATDQNYFADIQERIKRHKLDQVITLLGEQQNVPAYLQACDIGVLSSVSEGTPLALLEYGASKLAVVTTDVGECREVLDNGAVGILVPPKDPEKLARALVELLKSPEKRKDYSEKLFLQVKQNYSTNAIIEQICQIYDCVLKNKK